MGGTTPGQMPLESIEKVTGAGSGGMPGINPRTLLGEIKADLCEFRPTWFTK